jgi:CheY-like chemotaxis protein
MTSTERAGRSVLDYETEDALRRALMAFDLNDNDNVSGEDTMDTSTPEGPYDTGLDWVLPSYDPETTEAQSMKQEIRRLQVLKKYMDAGSDKKATFDRITGMVARIFHMPIAIISLIDLGRSLVLSNVGLGDIKESTRKIAFCAHTILSKTNMLIVPDATKDFRFQNNVVVTNPPHVTFYAGTPLISPEGFNLGTLCIVDVKPHPKGWFSEDDQATLKDMAQVVVDTMVNSRNERDRQGTPAQFMAFTGTYTPYCQHWTSKCAHTSGSHCPAFFPAHDLMTPLNGVQLSLSMLEGDENMKQKINPYQQELLATASTCSGLMMRICNSAIDAVREGSSDEFGMDQDLLLEKSYVDELPITRMEELVKSLRMLTEPVPKHVPLVIRTDPTVPPLIMCDDLKLFRAAINLLTAAAKRTEEGVIELRIFPSKENAELVFECEDTGNDIPVEEYPYLFKGCNVESGGLQMSLSSVASVISSLDGSCGFRPRTDKLNNISGQQKTFKTGSVFWFSVPLFAPDTLLNAPSQQASIQKNDDLNEPHRPPREPHITPLVPSAGLTMHLTGCGANLSAAAASGGCQISSLSLPAGWVDASANGRSSTYGSSSVTKDSFTGVAYSACGKPSEVAVAHAAAAPIGIAKRALIIDDSLVIRKSLAIALERLGCDVVQASNGFDGLNAMKNSTFDFVLCDFLMPVMDGIDFVKQFRDWEVNHRGNQRGFVIGMSAHADGEMAAQGLKAGMDSFRLKPITMKDLCEIRDSSTDRSPREDNQLLGRESHAPDPVYESSSDGSIQKKRETDDDGSMASCHDGDFEAGHKRQRTNHTGQAHPGSDQKVCLMATDRPGTSPNEALERMQRLNWKVAIVHDRNDALRLLQMRNWDLVLIDEDVARAGGMKSIKTFREWEHEHRSIRQGNVVLVSDVNIPPPYDVHAIVQAPTGFDYVIGKPVAWDDVRYICYKQGNNTKH